MLKLANLRDLVARFVGVSPTLDRVLLGSIWWVVVQLTTRWGLHMIATFHNRAEQLPLFTSMRTLHTLDARSMLSPIASRKFWPGSHASTLTSWLDDVPPVAEFVRIGGVVVPVAPLAAYLREVSGPMMVLTLPMRRREMYARAETEREFLVLRGGGWVLALASVDAPANVTVPEFREVRHLAACSCCGVPLGESDSVEGAALLAGREGAQFELGAWWCSQCFATKAVCA